MQAVDGIGQQRVIYVGKVPLDVVRDVPHGEGKADLVAARRGNRDRSASRCQGRYHHPGLRLLLIDRDDLVDNACHVGIGGRASVWINLPAHKRDVRPEQLDVALHNLDYMPARVRDAAPTHRAAHDNGSHAGVIGQIRLRFFSPRRHRHRCHGKRNGKHGRQQAKKSATNHPCHTHTPSFRQHTGCF